MVYQDAPAPSLSPGDALVRVMASSLTPTELTWNETYSNCDGSERLPTIPGHEFSGIVDGLSEGVLPSMWLCVQRTSPQNRRHSVILRLPQSRSQH
jgi:NADPH:quinone reductase-like Zn-dependent oxidoreductase